MMRRRRRRASAQWYWADAVSNAVSSSSPAFGGYNFAFSWLIPPGRNDWVMDATHKDKIRYAGSHIWLDFRWRSVSSTAVAIPDVIFYIKKAAEDNTGTGLQAFTSTPFTSPPIPSTVTSWDAYPNDGLDSFMWSHVIRGMSPPNAYVGTYATSSSNNNGVNQFDHTPTGSDSNNSNVCRTFAVRQEWQPDVRIKTRRNFARGEGLAFLAVAVAPQAGIIAETKIWHRHLAYI